MRINGEEDTMFKNDLFDAASSHPYLHVHSLNTVKGSITGAYSARTPNINPSFILLAVQGNKVVCYVYEMIDDKVDVSKTEFSK